MLSFDFHGKNSFTDFGIYIEKMPNIPTPKRRVNSIAMPGKNGSLKYDENTYEDITIAISCGVSGDVTKRVGDIKAWLCGSGAGDLIFSFDDGKRYIAQVVNSFDFEFILNRFSTFIVVFNAEPFRYLALPYPVEIIENNTNIINIGSIYSEPLIEVYGDGDISLTIGTQDIKLSDVHGKVILNTMLKEIYNTELENRNFTMQGEFPIFNVGENIISFDGDLKKLVIHPNWRWL